MRSSCDSPPVRALTLVLASVLPGNMLLQKLAGHKQLATDQT